MKKISTLLVAGILGISLVAVPQAQAIPLMEYFKVDGAKLSAKNLTSSQIKFIKKKAASFPNYVRITCGAMVGVQVTKTEKKSAAALAKQVCNVATSANSELVADSVSAEVNDDYGTKKFDLYFVIREPRTLMFDGPFTDGDFPDSPSPVAFNKKVTVPGNTNNLQNAGLTFLGWTKNDDGTGKVFVAGDKIILKKPIILYPKWDASTFTVNVESLGDFGVDHLMIKYMTPYSWYEEVKSLGTGQSASLPVKNFIDQTSQLVVYAPGIVNSNSLTGTDAVNIHYQGGGNCGDPVDFVECSIWYVDVTADGSLTYHANPLN